MSKPTSKQIGFISHIVTSRYRGLIEPRYVKKTLQNGQIAKVDMSGKDLEEAISTWNIEDVSKIIALMSEDRDEEAKTIIKSKYATICQNLKK